MERLLEWQYHAGLALLMSKPTEYQLTEGEDHQCARPRGVEEWGVISKRSQNHILILVMNAHHWCTGCSSPGCSALVWWCHLSWCSAHDKPFLCQTWQGWCCFCSCRQHLRLCHPCVSQT